MASAEAAGSVWNPGSWHWESRKYDKWATETITRLLKAVEVSSDAHRARIVDVVSCKAEASVNIRKGKKITVFELSFKCAWEGSVIAGPASESCGGEVEVVDAMQDDLDEDFNVRVSLLKATSNAIGVPCKEMMRTTGAAAVRSVVAAFAAEFTAHDAALEDLATAHKRVEEEARRAAVARVEKADDKDRIAREQAAKEAARKEAELARAAAAPLSAAAAAAAAAPKGEGSVWNSGNYHWEEKPLTAWAKERLGAMLKGVALDVSKGHIAIVEATLTGEASASIRKGRKLVFFEFSIALKWEGTLLNSEGEVTGSGDGSAAIAELDQDAGADFPVTVSAAEDGGAADKELAALFRAEAVPELRALIGRFVAELKAQG